MAASGGRGSARESEASIVRKALLELELEEEALEQLDGPDGQPQRQQRLRSAYRRLAMKWHPDKNKGRRDEATAKFKRVAAAYELLSDENRLKRLESYEDYEDFCDVFDACK